ncbi:unnamed protein product [Diabrotica balteata]|uniref:Rhabdoid tumor deletion region protein 1 n=1 Tax=Diabrotica balteata TaxID=107213 RepID=A0A9N9T3U2_DIABA|nr:unnamed protein product [Diabrotica balteata]
MHSINKNSYLHNYFKDINPRLINRCVEKALGRKILDGHDLEPPFNRLCSEQPNIPIADLDIIHRPVGFGRCAMTKLRRELHHKDPKVVIAALESISELVIDSTRGYEALKLQVDERLTDLLMDENPAIRERTARALKILAKLAEGKTKIVKNSTLLHNLAACSEDNNKKVRLQVALVLQNIAEFWMTADTLVEFGFISIVLHILQNNEDNCIKLIHLKTLRALMYGIQGKMVALDNSGYNILLTFLNDENGPILSVALECLAMLTSTCLGEKFAREVNLLDTLDKLLQDERKEVHTQTAHVMMFCTVKGTGKILASKRPRIVPRLIQLCQNKENVNTQLFALQALTNICEHPAIRKQINTEFSHEVEKIQVGFDPNIKVHKDKLLEVISWTPHTT